MCVGWDVKKSSMKTSTKHSTKTKLKARRMWANYYDDRSILLHCDASAARVCAVSYGIEHPAVPVAVIPLDDVEKLVGRLFSARINADGITLANTRDMLTAIGAFVTVVVFVLVGVLIGGAL